MLSGFTGKDKNNPSITVLLDIEKIGNSGMTDPITIFSISLDCWEQWND